MILVSSDYENTIIEIKWTNFCYKALILPGVIIQAHAFTLQRYAFTPPHLTVSAEAKIMEIQPLVYVVCPVPCRWTYGKLS